MQLLIEMTDDECQRKNHRIYQIKIARSYVNLGLTLLYR